MKWAIREAVDVYFKAKSIFKLGARTIRAGEPVLIFDTVKTSTLEVAAEVSYVTGGRGNSRLLSYEGDKTLSFQFEDALLSAEGLAILSGADLIPARNKRLNGAPAEARSVIAHYTEKYAVTKGNVTDPSAKNNFPVDDAIGGKPQGGELNVWLTRKPYVGQNSSVYVMLLDSYGEIAGSPLQINLVNPSLLSMSALIAALKTANVADGETFMGVTIVDVDAPTAAELTAVNIAVTKGQSYLAKFNAGDEFIAFDTAGQPMSLVDFPDLTKYTITTLQAAVAAAGIPANGTFLGVTIPATITQVTVDAVNAVTASSYTNAEFDDKVGSYVDLATLKDADWTNAWGAKAKYTRKIATPANGKSGTWEVEGYAYLLAPSGGIAQPKCFKEGSSFVYKLNVPSILYQDIVLLDYYVEYNHDAVQVSILPDKFGPYLYVEGSSLVRRASDGMDLPVEFVIPKFKVTTALTFTLQSTGDASTFTFQGDAYPDFSKFDLTRKVLADIQILDADDNYDGAAGNVAAADPTSYKRYKYNVDQDGDYLWKDPSLEPHANIDYSDTADAVTGMYNPLNGGPATITPGAGLIG